MSSLVKDDQPAPTPTDERPVWELVVEDMLERNRDGIEKYGTPLQATNGRDALKDAYQESLDQTVYLRQEIERRKKTRVLEVDCCGNCPFSYDEAHDLPCSLTCDHRDRPANVPSVFVGTALSTDPIPDWCPLRSAPTLVRLK